MGLINVKEKVTKTLGEFLDRNKEYIIDAYISDPVASHIIGRMYITTNRTFKTDDKGFTLEWDNKQDIAYNDLSISYDDILACYEERDKYNQQMIHVILKNGIMIYFECVGLMI